MKVLKDMSYGFFFLCLLFAMVPVSSALSFGLPRSEEIKFVERREASLFPELNVRRGLVRPGFIGLISEEEERRISIGLSPLIDPLDPFTIRISSLDLVHEFYMGR